MNKKFKSETLRSVGANLQATINVINCFLLETGWKIGEKQSIVLKHILCKNSLDDSENPLDH